MKQSFLSLQLNAVLTIAARDFTKLLRDRPRILISLIFPVIFIGVLGGSFQSSLGKRLDFNLQTFIFIGVFAQTMFQSTASGIISLIQDRESDFSQEIFVSPISRYTIIFGKIMGETLVSFVQVIGIILFGYLIGIHISLNQLLSLIPAGLVAALFGGAFGTLVLANLGNQRSANQVFPFLIFPQIFLSGVFNPINNIQGSPSFDLGSILYVLSRIIPLTYAVDFVRGVFYAGMPEQHLTTIHRPTIDLFIIIIYFSVMLFLGTWLFVKNERNR